MIIRYHNKYGSLEIEVIEAYRNISTIRSKELSSALFFDISTAEKVALITENKGVQLSPTADYKTMYLVHHESPSMAAVCRVVKVDFNADYDARKELAKPNYYGGPIIG